MKFYLELTIIPSPEIPVHFIWEKLFQELHLAFVECKNPDGTNPMGISFPNYRTVKGDHPLGERLRIFSEVESALEKLHATQKLQRLQDYVHMKSTQGVPQNIQGYSCYKRKQIHHVNLEDRIHHQAERHGVSLAEAKRHFSEYKEQLLPPFVYLDSQSTKQTRFRLFIEKVCMPNENKGVFSSYGLSATATVPEF